MRVVPFLVVVLTLAGCTSPQQRLPGPSPTSVTPSAADPQTPPSVVRFAVKGDWGSGRPAQKRVTDAMCRLRIDRPYDVVVTTGDNFYFPDGVAHEENFFGPEACLLAHGGHVWKASWGNHDVAGRSTAEQLGATRRYYSWSTPEFDLWVLDSTRVGDAAQTEWLRTSLEASGARVKLVVFHHPPFTVGGHPNNVQVQRHWVPLFERSGVTLVLNGHNHGYEHSVVNGVHYVVTGGGGAPLYPCLRDEPWLIRCLSVNHFLVVEISLGHVQVEAIDPEGTTFDSIRINPAQVSRVSGSETKSSTRRRSTVSSSRSTVAGSSTRSSDSSRMVRA